MYYCRNKALLEKHLSYGMLFRCIYVDIGRKNHLFMRRRTELHRKPETQKWQLMKAAFLLSLSHIIGYCILVARIAVTYNIA